MRKASVLIIPGPPRLSYPALMNMVEILMPLTKTIYIELQDEPQINFAVFNGHGLDYDILKTARVPSAKVVKSIFVDFISIVYLIKMRKKIDILLNFQSESTLLTLMAKLLRKRVIHFMGGSLSKSVKAIIQLPNLTFVYKMLWLVYGSMSTLAFMLSDKIVLITPKIVEEAFHRKYSKKIKIAYNSPSSHFYKDFYISKTFSQRPLQIGYIGELSPAKGVWQLAMAIPEILSALPDLKILFIGDIESKKPNNIGKIVQEKLSPYESVIFVGPLSHDVLPQYLNELRLVVLPSFSEGVPAVVLEAMACGTPVAATPVGAIPEMIADGRTGYILKSNSPDYLSKTILRILNDKTIHKVAAYAHNRVQIDFTYEKTVAIWQKILQEIQ